MHVSTGSLPEKLSQETELGKLAARYMNAGELVPDDVTIAMVEEIWDAQIASRELF